MPLTTSKELKHMDNKEFYSAITQTITVIQTQFERAKKQEITYSLSKAGKFEIWLEHSQLTDSIELTINDMMQAIQDKKRKSKLIKYYEKLYDDFQTYLDNWHKVDEALKAARHSPPGHHTTVSSGLASPTRSMSMVSSSSGNFPSTSKRGSSVSSRSGGAGDRNINSLSTVSSISTSTTATSSSTASDYSTSSQQKKTWI